MDPILPIPPAQPVPTTQSFGSIPFFPGVFASAQEGDEYLASLDSDTRDYVLKHTDEFRSRSDIIECVNHLHGQG
jgi:hypothetical protein